ncbi:Glycerate 2-kinase [Lentibacillus sp. JNUCC-1]|uniref:glycerate kinase n=1 Tax=Lentibacillus sp. JNUCC-1 TaxID=2654513 RepID=UPI0012E766E0|nr:glycerate kinase [Lentibacillus sp. JNUCC-1]MUV36682.1 Glycerate 2-kinase [Lentibacillus sp. JNUCC-1]
MNIVVAPDSFKGSLTATQAAEVMKQAVLEVTKSAYVSLKPMADGGEGTLEAISTAKEGTEIPLTCTGPLGEPIQTSYALVEAQTAVIECAKVAGLTQVPEKLRNPDYTTSFGIGEMMLNAIDRGCSTIILGLGGSAVNDGGFGMLQALGLKGFDQAGNLCGLFGKDMLCVDAINNTQMDGRLANVNLKVANDVDNPLCGDNGATAVYGPQKGATPKQITLYDKGLASFGQMIEKTFKGSFMHQAGAGAAGGLGFALLALGADLKPGAKLIADYIQLEEAIRHADLVLTGEGQSDRQTLYGKAPGYVGELAARHHVPAVLISGALSDDMDILRDRFAGCFSIVHKPLTLEESMTDTEKLLFNQTVQVMQLWQSARKSNICY